MKNPIHVHSHIQSHNSFIKPFVHSLLSMRLANISRVLTSAKSRVFPLACAFAL